MYTFKYFESSTRGILNILKMFHHFRQMFNEITTHEMPHHSIPFPPFPLSLIFPRITQFSFPRLGKKNSAKILSVWRFSRDFRAQLPEAPSLPRSQSIYAAICILKLSTARQRAIRIANSDIIMPLS